MRLLPLLLLAACAGPTEPRVVQRLAAWSDTTTFDLDITKTAPRERQPVQEIAPCTLVEVPTLVVVDGVRYIIIQYHLFC